MSRGEKAAHMMKPRRDSCVCSAGEKSSSSTTEPESKERNQCLGSIFLYFALPVSHERAHWRPGTSASLRQSSTALSEREDGRTPRGSLKAVYY